MEKKINQTAKNGFFTLPTDGKFSFKQKITKKKTDIFRFFQRKNVHLIDFCFQVLLFTYRGPDT
jgi:hypothetical protein